MALNITTIISGLLLAFITHRLWTLLYNFAFHPLSKFPGPPIVCTGWYRCWNDVFLKRNWTDVLYELHDKYGEVVRVGPDELHFSRPETFHEIYSNTNRWNKHEKPYHCFGQDRSSFGFLMYREAKTRKDVLAPMFSKRTTSEMQGLVKKHLDRLCKSLASNYVSGKNSDMLFGLQCFSLDCITTYCFAKDVKATEAPEFRNPIIVAMDASLPGFLTLLHFGFLRKLVFGMPGWLAKATNPMMTGRVDLQEMLEQQVKDFMANPKLLKDTSNPTIYHRLLDPELNKAAGVPSTGSLYEEALSLFFGGAESSGNTTMLGSYHILQNPEIEKRLKEELREAWPVLDEMPKLEELEKLPYLTAVIKESLRVAPSVPYPLPRVVPATGATLSGQHIPGATNVGMSLRFVHMSEEIFANPKKFEPDRWLQPDSAALDKWLVAFSKGPRGCIGQNLAMCELYMAFAALFRRFELQLDGTKPEDVTWIECFSPHFDPNHMRAFCKPLEA